MDINEILKNSKKTRAKRGGGKSSFPENERTPLGPYIGDTHGSDSEMSHKKQKLTL